MMDSTIHGNQAGSNGGGIENSGGITLVNSTVSGNQVNGSGGGLYNSTFGTLESRNATIVSNTANADGGGLSRYGGGIANDDGGTVNLANTILSSNIHVIVNDFGPFAVNDDCKGTLNQFRYSLLTTTTGCSFTNDNSITGVNPKLEALADNGGPNQTHALKADSPAIDAGDLNGCKDPEEIILTSDQRGELRPFDGDMDGTAVCDIGAYEYIIYQPLTVNKVGSGDGSITSTPAGIDCDPDCSANFPQNSLVTLTAVPEDGSAFGGWSGACIGTGDCQVTMDAQKTITATFSADLQLTIDKAGTGDGQISSSPAGIDCGQDCSAAFAQESLVTLTADPEEGSAFSGWGGACSGTDDCQIAMDADKNITATFVAAEETLLHLFLPMSLR